MPPRTDLDDLPPRQIKAKPDVGGTAALPGVQCDLWEGCLTLKDYIFTSESVSEGHPDKVCDQISDAILDAFIANDVKLGHADDSHANTRLGCETLATTNKIVIAGEGRASAPYMHKYGKHTIVNREALDRDRAQCRARHRLRPGRLQLPRRRRRGAAARPVARHRHGRRRQEEGRQSRRAGRRGRPGPDVRLRLPRQRGIREGLVHAGPDLSSRTRSSRC